MSPTILSIVLYLIDAAKENQTGPVVCYWCNNRVNIINHGKYQRYGFTSDELRALGSDHANLFKLHQIYSNTRCYHRLAVRFQGQNGRCKPPAAPGVGNRHRIGSHFDLSLGL